MLGCQSRFDCALELSRIGLHIALVAAQHGAVFAHEKLLEVPGHGASGLGLAEGAVSDRSLLVVTIVSPVASVGELGVAA